MGERPELQTEQVERFLQALDPEANAFTFQSFGDSERNDELTRVYNGPFAQLATQLRALNDRGAGVYVTVARTDLQGRRKENVLAPRAVFCDFDGVEPARGAGALPPSITVQSKNGKHLYWLLDNPESLEKWSLVQEAMARKLGADPACKDAPRVMRLPGMLHQKDRDDPFVVQLLQCHPDRRYTLDQIVHAYGLDLTKSTKPTQKLPPAEGSRPGDDFNANGSWDFLERHGWTRLRDYGDEGRWSRPDKHPPGVSATTDHDGHIGIFFVFTSAAPPFEPQTGYSRFRAYALLEHGGDYAAAAKQLSSEGYGEDRDKWVAAQRRAQDDIHWEVTLANPPAELLGGPPPGFDDVPWPELDEEPPPARRRNGANGSRRPNGSNGSNGGPRSAWGTTPVTREPSGDGPIDGNLTDFQISGMSPDGFPLTQVGNAQRFIRDHGGYVRYCPTWDRWLYWDGKRWSEDRDAEEGDDDLEAEGIVYSLCIRTMRAMQEQVAKIPKDTDNSDAMLNAWRSHCKRSETHSHVTGVLKIAGHQPTTRVPPPTFDRPKNLINTASGVLDLRTKALRRPERSQYLSRITQITYDPDAQCDTWLSFLDDIMDRDEDLIGFLQRAIGYSLSGETSEQCLFLLWGTGRNGKSTFLNVLQWLAGEYSRTAEFSTFQEKQNDTVRNDLARLHRSRMVSALEPSASRRLDEGMIKALTGQDPITARFLFREYFTFTPTFKVWLAANHKPEIKGNDEGIWRRIKLIPFNVTIPKAEVDRDLPNKLRAEIGGIFRWAVEGAYDWYAHGLLTPDKVDMATQSYRTEMDSLGAFIEANCTVAENESVRQRVLYKAYEKWAKDSGERPMPAKTFYQRITERGFERSARRSYGYEYFGLGLNNDPDKRPAQEDPRVKDD